MNNFCILAMQNFIGRSQELNERLKVLFNTETSFLNPVKNIRFANGEGKIVIENSVRNKTVFIVSDVSNYSQTYNINGFFNHYSPDDHFQDIKRVVSAIAGKAEKIIVITPLLYEARQHRRSMRESLDCAMALQELERLGVDGIITFDAHDPNIQNAVSRLSFDTFFPSSEILKSLLKHAKENIDSDKVVVISPDTGAMQRAVAYANMLGLDVGIFYKRRDFTKIISGKNPVVQHEYLGSDVNGKNILIVDDMISSGGSVIDVIQELNKRGSKGAYVIATFAFFTSGIDEFRKLYSKGLLKKVFSTNMSYLPNEIINEPWFEYVNLIPFMADIIANIIKGESLSSMIDSSEEIKKILTIHNKINKNFSDK